MATYNFSDVTVTGAFPYALAGIVSLAAFGFAYAAKGQRRAYAIGLGVVAGIVFVAAIPKADAPDMTSGILDYNTNLTSP
jgi:ABC-type uncharacterized transport system permease subunit